jgi:hypothetical protein
MMMDEPQDEELTGTLAGALSTLREDVPVRANWRAALLERIDADRLRKPVWRVRPSLAIAAGIALLIAGMALGRYSRQPNDPIMNRVADVPTANVRFVLVAPGAAHVSVVGDFNQWNATAMPLKKLSDGTWIADVPLGPGRYAYAFVVDGEIQVDPAAPRAESDFGENSILMVRGS